MERQIQTVLLICIIGGGGINRKLWVRCSRMSNFWILSYQKCLSVIKRDIQSCFPKGISKLFSVLTFEEQFIHSTIPTASVPVHLIDNLCFVTQPVYSFLNDPDFLIFFCLFICFIFGFFPLRIFSLYRPFYQILHWES